MAVRLAAVAAVLIAGTAQTAEVRIVPGDSICLNATNPQRGYRDLVIHTVAIATAADERLQVEGLTLEVLGKDGGLSERIGSDRLVASTARLAGAPVPAFLTGQLLDARGLTGLFGREVGFAPSAALGPSQALVGAGYHFSVGFAPQTVRATIEGRNASGGPVRVQALVPVVACLSAVAHRAPVRGAWMMQALPGVQSHHRFNPSTEFAVDFFRPDAEGRIAKGDPLVAASAYGYGQPVTTSADGEVVSVIADVTQDRAALTRRPDETPQQAGERIGRYNMERYAQDFPRASAGNLVVIRHQAGGRVEYSAYGHLKAGSVLVRPGQQVRQGEAIGEVGDTGDSAAVHLHFQLNAGPDPFTSKSLPVTFTDVKPTGPSPEPGLFVAAG